MFEPPVLKLVIPLEKLEISLSPELLERIDDVVELLDYKTREELIRCSVRRYVDKYPTSEPRAR